MHILARAGYKIRNQHAIHFITTTVIDWVEVFNLPACAQIVIDSLNYCVAHKGLRIHAWCLMSNHIHLIVSTQAPYRLSSILRDFKKFTSIEIINQMRQDLDDPMNRWMLGVFKSKGRRNARNRNYQIWKHNNCPKELYSNEFKDRKLNYIHSNPVKAGLVDKPERYRWSSAIDYAGGQGLVKVEFL